MTQTGIRDFNRIVIGTRERCHYKTKAQVLSDIVIDIK